MKRLTVMEANQLAEKCEKLFRRSALAWERGNNSGNSAALARGEKLCDKHRNTAEALLKPLGIKCDYPGLYPSFQVRGFTEYGCLQAISRALEKGAA